MGIFWYTRAMKKIASLFILGALVFGTHSVSAQTTEELEIQYRDLLMQLLSILQSQQGDSSSLVAGYALPANQLCGIRYDGIDSSVAIQQELKNQGYSITKIDGKVGPETSAAVRAFQSAAGAAKVDGIIGQETRTLLSKASVACEGDAGVTQSGNTVVDTSVSGDVVVTESITTDAAPITNGLCRLPYTGTDAAIAIQQELKNQGYTITKVDGKVGPETRAAISAFQTSINAQKIDGIAGVETRRELSRKSVMCNDINTTTTTTQETNTSTTVESNQNTTVTVEAEPEVTVTPIIVDETPSATVTLLATSITAAARSTTAGIPDDTAVFTYRLTFNTNADMFISTNPDQAFAIAVNKSGVGNVSTATGVKSVISTAQKIIRQDGASFFKIQNGDTMSLRLSLQPGAGSYNGLLERLTYTVDNAFTVVSPSYVNYEFDVDTWQSEIVQLLN